MSSLLNTATQAEAFISQIFIEKIYISIYILYTSYLHVYIILYIYYELTNFLCLIASTEMKPVRVREVETECRRKGCSSEDRNKGLSLYLLSLLCKPHFRLSAKLGARNPPLETHYRLHLNLGHPSTRHNLTGSSSSSSSWAFFLLSQLLHWTTLTGRTYLRERFFRSEGRNGVRCGVMNVPVIAFVASFNLSSPSPNEELWERVCPLLLILILLLCTVWPLWTAVDGCVNVAGWLLLVDSSYIDNDMMLCLIIDEVMLEDMLCWLWNEKRKGTSKYTKERNV